MARSKSSRRWLQEHFADEYVKQAQLQGYRSRALFKLKEINDKDRILQPGMTVVDLGAAPGGWSQVARAIVGGKGRVVATDILPMDALAGVTFLDPASSAVGPEVAIAPDSVVHPHTTLAGRCRIGRAATIHAGAWIRDSEIGDGATIEPYSVIDGATIGAGCRVGPGVGPQGAG